MIVTDKDSKVTEKSDDVVTLTLKMKVIKMETVTETLTIVVGVTLILSKTETVKMIVKVTVSVRETMTETSRLTLKLIVIVRETLTEMLTDTVAKARNRDQDCNSVSKETVIPRFTVIAPVRVTLTVTLTVIVIGTLTFTE